MSRLLQVLIALVGLGLTGMLGYASMQNEKLQTKQQLLALFSDSVSVARSTCDVGLLFIAQDAVNELAKIDAEASKKYGERLDEVDASIRGPACVTATTAAAAVAANNPSVLAAAPAPVAPINGDAEARDRAAAQAPAAAAARKEVQEQAQQVQITTQMVARSQNLEFRKAQDKILGNVAGGRFFAVVASYGLGESSTYDEKLGAAAHYNQLVAVTRERNVRVAVYRARASNHFAIVLVANPPTREGARDLVLLARREGWSPDAFVQVEKEWVQCKEPGSIAGLKACAE